MPVSDVLLLASTYVIVTAGLFAGFAWTVTVAQRRQEGHVIAVLDRFLARSYGDLQAAQVLAQGAAEREVAQQEGLDLDDPEFIKQMLREAEADVRHRAEAETS